MDTKKLRQKILDLAIHGKLVPQDPNDEPASVLLERIKAEKERLIKEGKIKRTKKSAKSSDTPHYQQDVPFEVPSNWVWTTLGSVCNFENGFAFSSDDYKQEGIPLIRISNISDNSIDLDGCVFIQKEIDDRFVVKNGDLLIALSGATTGKMGVYSNDKVAYLNQRVGNLRIIDTLILCPEYRNIFMYSKTETILKLAYGGAQPNISGSVICSFLFPLPPLEEQQRIVAEVNHWFALIEQIEHGKADLQTIIKQTKGKILDLAIRGRLVPQDPNDEPTSELLKRINPKAEITCDNGHYTQLPKNWVCALHNNVVEISGGAQPAKSKFSTLPKPNYIRLYQIRDYGENPVPIYIPIDLAKKKTIKGDILLARYGGSLGKVFIAEEGAYNVALAKVIFKYKGLINKDFAYFYYLSDIYQNKLKEISRTAQAGFNSSDFNDMIFPIPPLKEQKRIVKAIETIYQQLDVIMENL